MLTSNSRMNTSPLAHEPQLDQHSGYFGMRTETWTLAFSGKPLHSTPRPV
jgi:hypothetical protein